MSRIDMVHARVAAIVLAVSTVAGVGAGTDVALPRAADSLKFAVVGDNGTGEQPQYEVARQMAASRSSFTHHPGLRTRRRLLRPPLRASLGQREISLGSKAPRKAFPMVFLLNQQHLNRRLTVRCRRVRLRPRRPRVNRPKVLDL